MEAPITPRVNSANIPTYANRTVRLVGKVIQNQGSTAVIEASDKGKVNISLSPECVLGTSYVEVIGQVQSDGSIRAYWSTNFGENFDLDAYESLVQAASKYGQIYE